MVIFDPYRIDTAQLIAKSFITGDYIRNSCSCAKFGANLSTGEGLLGNG